MDEYTKYNGLEKQSIKEKIKEIWYKYKKYIIILACLIVITIIALLIMKSINNKRINREKYQNIERIMILNAQNYVKNNKIEKDIYISLNYLNIKIDEELKCDILSGIYKKEGSYYPYLICEEYKSRSIEEIIEENKKNKEYGEIKGDNPLIVNESIYQEEGIESEYEVNIKGNDIENGVNVVTYYLNKEGKYVGELKRIVIAEEIEGSYPKITLYGNKTRTITRGSAYKEIGYEANDEHDGDITKKVKVEGKVDTEKVGTYKVTYSVTNTRNKTSKEERTIVVTESNISLDISHTIEPNTITKKSVTMKVAIKGFGYKYIVLPDNSKNDENEVTYTVYKNGTYDFIIYDTNDNSEVYSIKITNINTDPPKGTCVVTYEEAKSTVKITAEEPTLIDKYQIYNGDKLLATTKKVTYAFNEYPTNTKVKLIDTSNKSKVINCKVKDVIYNDYGPCKVEYKSVYVGHDKYEYGICVPEKYNGQKLPMIMFLHGMTSDEESSFYTNFYSWSNTGFNGALNDWPKFGLKNIPAIMVMPWSKGPDKWNHKWKYIHIDAVYNEVINNYNIETNNVCLMGASIGGQGVFTVAAEFPTRFKSLVPMSARITKPVTGDIEYFKNMPMKGFAEKYNPATHSESYNYERIMTELFNNIGHPNDLRVVPVKHGAVPEYALRIDENGDGISDLVYWIINGGKDPEL